MKNQTLIPILLIIVSIILFICGMIFGLAHPYIFSENDSSSEPNLIAIYNLDDHGELKQKNDIWIGNEIGNTGIEPFVKRTNECVLIGVQIKL